MASYRQRKQLQRGPMYIIIFFKKIITYKLNWKNKKINKLNSCHYVVAIKFIV